MAIRAHIPPALLMSMTSATILKNYRMRQARDAETSEWKVMGNPERFPHLAMIVDRIITIVTT